MASVEKTCDTCDGEGFIEGTVCTDCDGMGWYYINEEDMDDEDD